MKVRLRRILTALALVVILIVGAYWLWQPGGHPPLPPAPSHGAWLTHAWWGDEEWFGDSARKREDYFGAEKVARLRGLLELGITDWYVHACPCSSQGDLPEIDIDQARLLVKANPDGQVLAWVGGILGADAHPENPGWRAQFARSCGDLVETTGLAGIQLNIEPCPSFTPGYLELLEDLREALPRGSRLSVVAYPPPTWLHPFKTVHWNEDFYREVSGRCDDLAVMAYDTAQPLGKPYIWMVARWSSQIYAWSSVPVKIGIPAYDDHGMAYHHARVENVPNGLAGLAAAVQESTPDNYAGIAIYAEWTLDPAEEAQLATWLRRTGH